MPAQRPWLERSLAPRPLLERRIAGASVPTDLLLSPTVPVRTRAVSDDREAQRLSPLAARLSAWIGLALAVGLPVVLWSQDVGTVASEFHLGLGYLLTGWGAYLLIAWGLVLLAGALLGSVKDRLQAPRRRAWTTWGISLYLLGMLLASQVSAFLH